jgi:hypothetical protein
LGPPAAIPCADNNTCDAGTLQFGPAKDRYAAGLLAQAGATQTVLLSPRAGNIRMLGMLVNRQISNFAVPLGVRHSLADCGRLQRKTSEEAT